MSSSYLGAFSTRHTPQSEPIPGSNQAPNNAGGYTWTITPWQRLERFLILGAEGGTYYVGERDLTRQNGEVILTCLQQDGGRTVDTIRDVSVSGRAPKNDPAIFALALAASFGDVPDEPKSTDPRHDEWRDATQYVLGVRQAALDALPDVCRTATHLFLFFDLVRRHRGGGPMLRRAIGDWYMKRSPDELAYQLVKYRSRHGYAHRDVLRLMRPKATDSEMDRLFAWAVGKPIPNPPRMIAAFEAAQRAAMPFETAAVVRGTRGLPWEALKSEHLTDPDVWRALLPSMPMHALIRNLPTMTRHGVIAPGSDETFAIAERLVDERSLRRSRVHPLQVLVALRTYASGRSMRGNAQWSPVTTIVDALDAAFYESFGNVVPTNKRVLIGLDVSGSMSTREVAGMPGITPAVAATAMSMITAAVEPRHEIVGFGAPAGHSGPGHHWGYRGTTVVDRLSGVVSLPISPRQRLDDIVHRTGQMNFGATDCALPMLYALAKGRQFDAFVVYTDNETWFGEVHPAQALVDYRRRTGINATLTVVGMTASEFSIADPNDPGMLDVVGFDTAAPSLISDFIANAA